MTSRSGGWGSTAGKASSEPGWAMVRSGGQAGRTASRRCGRAAEPPMQPQPQPASPAALGAPPSCRTCLLMTYVPSSPSRSVSTPCCGHGSVTRGGVLCSQPWRGSAAAALANPAAKMCTQEPCKAACSRCTPHLHQRTPAPLPGTAEQGSREAQAGSGVAPGCRGMAAARRQQQRAPEGSPAAHLHHVAVRLSNRCGLMPLPSLSIAEHTSTAACRGPLPPSGHNRHKPHLQPLQQVVQRVVHDLVEVWLRQLLRSMAAAARNGR